jgi:hypothetical protein
MTADFSLEYMEARGSSTMFFKYYDKITINPNFIYAAKISFKNEREWARDVAQCHICLVWTRSWVQSLAPKKKIKKKQEQEGWECSSMVEYLPSNHKTLSDPQHHKQTNKIKGREVYG